MVTVLFAEYRPGFYIRVVCPERLDCELFLPLDNSKSAPIFALLSGSVTPASLSRKRCFPRLTRWKSRAWKRPYWSPRFAHHSVLRNGEPPVWLLKVTRAYRGIDAAERESTLRSPQPVREWLQPVVDEVRSRVVVPGCNIYINVESSVRVCHPGWKDGISFFPFSIARFRNQRIACGQSLRR